MHRTTLLSTLALALSSTTLIAAQGIENDDIAPQCASVCTNIATVSDDCERQFDDANNEDQLEQDCICNAQGMSTAIPECEACQRQYYGQDDDYDEIQTLLQRCGFSSMSATGTMTSMGSSPTGQMTVITSTYTETDDDDDNDIDIETTTYTSFLQTSDAGTTTAAGGAGSSATDAAGSAADSATDAAGSATDQSGNFAPVVTAAPVLAMAGVAAVVFGL